MKKMTINWYWEDIQNIRDDWTQEQCCKALAFIHRAFTERISEEGNQILEDLVFLNEKEIEEARK